MHPDIGNTDLRQPLTSDKGRHIDADELENLDAIAELEADAVKQAAVQQTGKLELRDLLDEHGNPDMRKVKAWQDRQPLAVQIKVADRPHASFAEYFATVDRLNREMGARVVTDEMVNAMSLEEYDQHFDQQGRPRDHVIYRPTRQVPIRRGGQ